ncbi:MAG: methyltransferase domain-containing protein, partial [Rhodothermales bacterium]|nr:methyltransferase domain-containing protein [Rhodothermales bacterium]
TDRALSLALLGALAVFGIAARVPQWWPWFVTSALVVGLIQWRLYVRDGLTLGGIALFAIGARLLLFPIPPVLSDDMYRYIWDGILVVDGINPYAFVPLDGQLSEYHGLPVFEVLNSGEFHSVYPPVSQLVFAAGALVARQDWMTGYYVIKGIIVTLECAGLVLLTRVLPRRQLLLLSVHPVLLIAGAAQGHTDALLVFFLGSAFLAWRHDRTVWAVALITLAGWVKLVPLLFIPLFAPRRPRSVLTTAGVVTALVSVPFYETYVLGNVMHSLDLYVRYFEFYAGPYYAVKQLMLELTGDDWSKQLGPAFRTAFLIVVGAAWVAHFRWRLDPWKSALGVTGAYLLLSTTIHPWYFTGLLVLIAINGRYAAHWQWASIWSIGTYLLYVDGPYWSFVIVGWVGFLLLMIGDGRYGIVATALRLRAYEKVRSVREWLADIEPGSRVLDIGAGEGYVGMLIADQTGANVTLVETRRASRVKQLREIIYDGTTLEEPSDSYDVVVLFYVLHHAEHPDRVLSEAVRVSRDRVIIVESVHDGTQEKRRFERMDRIANRLRAGWNRTSFEEHLDMRTATEWEEMIQEAGGSIADSMHRYRPWHRQAFWLVRA